MNVNYSYNEMKNMEKIMINVRWSAKTHDLFTVMDEFVYNGSMLRGSLLLDNGRKKIINIPIADIIEFSGTTHVDTLRNEVIVNELRRQLDDTEFAHKRQNVLVNKLVNKEHEFKVSLRALISGCKLTKASGNMIKYDTLIEQLEVLANG